MHIKTNNRMEERDKTMSECTHNCETCHAKCSERQGEMPPSRLDKIKHKLLVLSGKGGVGKSTMAAGLAVSLTKAGYKVALLDVDFHGPSQPTLFGLKDHRLDGDEEGINPAETASGVKLVSLGLLVDNSNAAVIWRGPAKIGVLKQLFEEVNWGDDLDYLVLDFPPGTGDEVLSACQMIPGDKQAVMITTPQEVSLADCRKCLDFCRQVNVPVLGIVENMSGFICPNCNTKHALFSSGGGQLLADVHGIDLIAQVPLDPAFLQNCDNGRIAEGIEASPAVAAELASAVAAIKNATQKDA